MAGAPIPWQTSMLYIGPTYAGGMYYYIRWPGPDATNPSFQLFKAIPPDMSGLPVPTTGVTQMGTFGTLAAAQAAGNVDVNPPIPASLHQQVPVA